MEAERYPISVRMIGVMHKDKNKLYMASVLWSDQNDIVVYRTLKDFVKTHKELKKAFPAASKLRKSDRVIPKFPIKKMKSKGKKNSTSKSMMRLKCLQKYIDDLLNSDPRVTQSNGLIQFFHPKDQDLQPEFSKNSVMIMLSEDEISAQGRHGSGGGNVTQPFVTETYRCVAPYETKDTKNKPFKVALDEKVDVLIKDKQGWWLVENEEKRMAWFPAPYLEKLDDDDDDDDDDLDGAQERGMLYCAVKSYKANKDDEISVPIGAVVEVLQKSENGWWLIRYNRKAGYIPTMFLQPYNYPHIRLTAKSQDFRPSSPLQVPSLNQQSPQFSGSQGNLLLSPPVRSSSPNPLQQESREMSRSLNVLSDLPPPPYPAAGSARPASSADRAAVTPTSPQQPPPPAITVEMDGEEEQGRRRWREESDGSFSSDSTDFSFSDDLSSSSASSTYNLSPTANDDQIRLSRTPPPPSNNHLSPTSGQEGRLIPSVSDPNLYKGPVTPKIPPRPRAQEILKRCTTITRKNAARGASPTTPEIQSR